MEKPNSIRRSLGIIIACAVLVATLTYSLTYHNVPRTEEGSIADVSSVSTGTDGIVRYPIFNNWIRRTVESSAIPDDLQRYEIIVQFEDPSTASILTVTRRIYDTQPLSLQEAVFQEQKLLTDHSQNFLVQDSNFDDSIALHQGFISVSRDAEQPETWRWYSASLLTSVAGKSFYYTLRLTGPSIHQSIIERIHQSALQHFGLQGR